MQDKNQKWKEIVRRIQESQHILITTHIHPDGDAIGCEAAAYHFLRKMGKSPHVVNDSVVPAELQFLDTDTVFQRFGDEKDDELYDQIDLVLLFDVGSRSRVGRLIDIIDNLDAPVICIDHHPSNTFTFDVDIIDSSQAATACLVYELFEHISLKYMDVRIAEALYVGLLTDTGSFRFDSTTPEVFCLAAELISYGVSASEIYRKVYENRSPEQMRLLGMALQNVHYEKEGQLAWYVITMEMVAEARARIEDIDGFTDFIRSTKGVEVVVMFLEDRKNHIRLNFRSKGTYKVNGIATHFGGGGHANAAGATLDMALSPAIHTVLKELCDSMDAEDNASKMTNQ